MVDQGDNQLVRLSPSGGVVGLYSVRGGGGGDPSAVALLSRGGMAVLEHSACRVQVYKGLALRLAWMRLVVMCAHTLG